MRIAGGSAPDEASASDADASAAAPAASAPALPGGGAFFLSPTRFVARTLDDYGYTPLAPRTAVEAAQGPAAVAMTADELAGSRSESPEAAEAGAASAAPAADENNGGGGGSSEGGLDKSALLLQKLSAMSLASLSARIDRLLATDPSASALAASSATTNMGAARTNANTVGY